MTAKVVHCRKERYDVYIGRSIHRMHFGNPFSHLSFGLGWIKVASRAEAISRFRTWLDGTTDTDVEPERRLWILKQIPSLTGKVLGCFCRPSACHGDVLIERNCNNRQSQLPGFTC
jgi:hypothetical protein